MAEHHFYQVAKERKETTFTHIQKNEHFCWKKKQTHTHTSNQIPFDHSSWVFDAFVSFNVIKFFVFCVHFLLLLSVFWDLHELMT